MNPRARLSLFERLVTSHRGIQQFNPSDPDSDCWMWFGARDRKGYGLIKVDGRCQRVYRVAYELATGRKLGERTAEHTCRNPSCWRPSHIVPLSRAANTAKGNRDNPRSTEKARAVRQATLTVTWDNPTTNTDGSTIDPVQTVTPVTPRPEAGG